MPDSDKLLTVSRFIQCRDIDKLYFEPTLLSRPIDPEDAAALRLLAKAMVKENVAAIADGVLFRRNRTLLIRPDGHGAVIATTLNFDYEVRSAASTFKTIPTIQFEPEMLALAQHIIATKSGNFDPQDYHDRYDVALADLVRAKIEGRQLPKRKPEPQGKVIDLMEALRESAKTGVKRRTKRATPSAKTPRKQRKAS